MAKAKKVYFPKVVEARAALADKALELFTMYEQLIKDAIAAEEYDTAKQGLEFLIKHMPSSPDEGGMLDPSVDLGPQQSQKALPGVPQIRIGVAIGGMPESKALPPAVIDVTPEDVTGG